MRYPATCGYTSTTSSPRKEMLLQRRFKLNSWSSWCALGHCATCYGTSERVVSSKLVQHTHTPSAKFGREPPLHRSQRCRRPPRSHRPREALHTLVHSARPIMKAVQPSRHAICAQTSRDAAVIGTNQGSVLRRVLVKIADALAFVISFCFVTLAGVGRRKPPRI